MLKAELSNQKNNSEESLNLFISAHTVLTQYQLDKCRSIVDFIQTDL
jgi:hypothetical protein